MIYKAETDNIKDQVQLPSPFSLIVKLLFGQLQFSKQPSGHSEIMTLRHANVFWGFPLIYINCSSPTDFFFLLTVP